MVSQTIGKQSTVAIKKGAFWSPSTTVANNFIYVCE